MMLYLFYMILKEQHTLHALSRLSEPQIHPTIGTAVDQVGAQKLLGVTLDQFPNFNEHVDQLCKKLSQRIAVL